MDLNGDTGLSAGIKTAVYESQGKSKLMPIFDVFSEKGGNLDFHIVGWGVIQIVDSSWQGSRNSAVMVKKSYLYDGDLRPHHDLSNTGDIIDRAFTTPGPCEMRLILLVDAYLCTGACAAFLPLHRQIRIHSRATVKVLARLAWHVA